MCGKIIPVELTEKEYNDYYVKGMHIQHAMPTKSADERELLISNTCGPCFDNLFREDEDEDN